jgi:superfamily II DNA/RNA helicase
MNRVIVFTRTKHGANRVAEHLSRTGVVAEAIHGNKSQNQRERVLADFRSGKLRTLIATDIAARGIDVDGISHVFNFDLPNVPESYVHRIGRTARAGAEGVAISFCDHEEAAYLRDIERLIRMSIPSENRRTGKQPQGQHVQNAAPHQHKKHGNGGRNHRNNNNKRHRGHHENRNGGGGQRPLKHGAPNGQPNGSHKAASHGASVGAAKGEPTSIENVTFMQAPRRNAGDRAPR